MKITLDIGGSTLYADLNKPLDISLPLMQGKDNPNCYWAEPVKFETVYAEGFIGSVAEGGNVNYQKVSFTPHGNGTHTECFGHLSDDVSATLDNCLRHFHFIAELITVSPTLHGDDYIIMADEVLPKIKGKHIEALILRTLPNTIEKRTRQYSGTNPPFLAPELGIALANAGVSHLLVDLPSVDKEIDGGRLSVHRGFWDGSEGIRREATITELIYVDDKIKDGLYLLNLQIPSLVIDASPSKPVIYVLA